MSDWKNFEKRVVTESKLQRITCVKIPEHITFSGHRRKTQFDYCAGVDGVAAFFDCKCTGRLFNFKTYVLAEEKVHQYNALDSAQEFGNIGGYLIYFYEQGKIVWANVNVVRQMIQAGVKSLGPDAVGISVQSDAEPINLRALLAQDKAQIMGVLCRS